MFTKKRMFLLCFCSIALYTSAQRVKRKGVTPIDVTKKGPGINAGNGTTFNLEQFTGKWQETARVGRDNRAVEIIDTIMLHFPSPGKVTTRDGNHANINGAAEIEAPGNILIAAADVYTIVSVTPTQIVLDNQENFIHTLTRVEQFTHESYGKLAIKQDVYQEPVIVSLTDLLGRWSVYRRQARPGAIAPGSSIIKYLFITGKVDDNTANGEITFSKAEKSEAMSCSITLKGTAITVTAGTNRWELLIYKADGKELVFGNADTMLYYAKPL
ncbi:MAG TPA: hypothetical protein PKC39_03215 [Ferruginibacter sp.]|nr:hypothetical protein [Ferruginibacter sp.]HMP19948.1 hypothetical protein [Ferruginibacter sp.]